MPTQTTNLPSISFALRSPVTNVELNALFTTAWPSHTSSDFQPVLRASLTYICAYAGTQLVGFINLAWNGGSHAFILDTTVHSSFQRQGIGSQLLRQAVQVAHSHRIVWLHVDYEPHLDSFYRSCGFRSTMAGILNVQEPTV